MATSNPTKRRHLFAEKNNDKNQLQETNSGSEVDDLRYEKLKP